MHSQIHPQTDSLTPSSKILSTPDICHISPCEIACTFNSIQGTAIHEFHTKHDVFKEGCTLWRTLQIQPAGLLPSADDLVLLARNHEITTAV